MVGGQATGYGPRGNLPVRFWNKVHKTDQCWIWIAGKGVRGYGKFHVNGKDKQAHRVAYELVVGLIPDGLTLDHLCRNTSCVNPNHLEPVPVKENILRGNGLPARNARKTHCGQGHSFSIHGFINSMGWRECRLCSRKWKRAWKLRHRGPQQERGTSRRGG